MAELNLELWPRQIEAYETPATELLFGGATRGGKSHFIRVALIAWCLGIPQLQCTLIRKKYQDILDNHVYGPNGFQDLLRKQIARGEASVTQDGVKFANGSRITFKHCQDERQFETAQGITSHVLVVDEATQVSERLIRTFRAWCTMDVATKQALPPWARDRFPRIIYTANPIGVSVGFFRRHFVKARDNFSIEKAEGFLRQFIPSRVEDNPSEDPEATKGRVEGMNDAGIARALLEGDWDAPIGDFFPEYDDRIHAVPDFDPPEHLFKFRTFDWGTADPAACYWWAVSDGEPFEDQLGRQRWFPRGAFIAYREWYICNPDKPAEGLRMRNHDMAKGILERSGEREKNLITLTDSLPFQDRGGETIAETFHNCGLDLTLGDVSRIPGWSQLRSRLIGIEVDSNDKRRTPMIFFTASCAAARDYIPALPRHPTKSEDAAESGEATHACDAIRLACMARTRIRDLTPAEPKTDNIKNDRTFDQAVQVITKRKKAASGGRY